MGPSRIEVRLVVFLDSVKVETVECGYTSTVGWFRDEVSSMGATIERLLMQSAILPELRKLPEFNISCEYRQLTSGHEISQFRRGTAVKNTQHARKIVLSSGARSKVWLSD